MFLDVIIDLYNLLSYNLEVEHSRTDLHDIVYILCNINPSEDKTRIKSRYLDSLRQPTLNVSTTSEVST